MISILKYNGLFLFCSLFFLACADTTPTDTNEEETEIITEEINEIIPMVYVIAGDYYDILLGLEEQKMTGVYLDRMGGENACFFYFEGTVSENNPVKVNCYNPMKADRPIGGEFKIMGKEMLVKLTKKPMASCLSELTDEIGHPLLLDLQKKWLAIRIIETEATVYKDPVKGAVTAKNKLPKGTVVAVKEYHQNWVRVELPTLKEYKEEVWIAASVLYPLLDLK